jgi:hypothetical protein
MSRVHVLIWILSTLTFCVWFLSTVLDFKCLVYMFWFGFSLHLLFVRDFLAPFWLLNVSCTYFWLFPLLHYRFSPINLCLTTFRFIHKRVTLMILCWTVIFIKNITKYTFFSPTQRTYYHYIKKQTQGTS